MSNTTLGKNNDHPICVFHKTEAKMWSAQMASHVVSIIQNTLRAKSVTEARGQDCVDWSSLIKCSDSSDEKIMYDYKSSCISSSYSEPEITATVRLMGLPSTQHAKSALSLPISSWQPWLCLALFEMLFASQVYFYVYYSLWAIMSNMDGHSIF